MLKKIISDCKNNILANGLNLTILACSLNILFKEIKLINPFTSNFTYAHHLPGKINLIIILLVSFIKILWIKKNKISREFILINFAYSGLILCFILAFTNIANGAFTFFENINYHILFIYFLIFCLFTKNKTNNLILYSLCFALLMIPLSFIFYSHGKAVFTDDHAAVIYRLHLLKNHFPNIPIYNAMWNLGTDWRDFFATGILNVFIIFYPLLAFLDSLKAHAYIVPGLIFGVFPLSCFYAAKLQKISKTGCLFCAYLGITCTTLFYKWALSYGSLGFVCSLTLIPISASLMTRILEDSIHNSQIKRSHFFICALSLSLAACWSMLVVALLPLILFTFCYSIKAIFKDKTLRFTLLFFFILNLLWMSIFIKVSKVGSFIKAEKHTVATDAVYQGEYTTKSVKGVVAKINLKKNLHTIKDNLTKANPLLYVLAIPAVFFLNYRKIKLAFAANLTWLLLIGVFGQNFKPQLELDRFLIIFLVLSIIPTTKIIDKVFITSNNKKFLFKYILSSFIIISSFSFSSIVQNRGSHKFSLIPNELYLIAEKINENVSTGRIVFSGFILHDLGQGHLTPLAQLVKNPLVGSSPVHNLWWHTDVIPEYYRKNGSIGIEKYLNLINASLVLAHEKIWKEFFSNNKDIYTQIGNVGKFEFFTRKTNSNYFLEGEGEILNQSENEIHLSLKSDSAIIKFNYFPFLSVNSCKSIQPYSEEPNFTFIRLSECEKDKKIIIKSINPLKRLFS